MKWWQKAAEQGNAAAQYSLALIYRTGASGVTVNHTEAAKWFLKAAEQGNANAQLHLGVMYF